LERKEEIGFSQVMKALMLLTTILLLGACATTPTMKSVAGVYEQDTTRLVFRENGIFEYHINRTKWDHKGGGKWTITKEGEIHVEWGDGDIVTHRINKDGSITDIARISKDGKRKEIEIENRTTWKKIN
jgi:outer membrane lipoprotein-sorting protein